MDIIHTWFNTCECMCDSAYAHKYNVHAKAYTCTSRYNLSRCRRTVWAPHMRIGEETAYWFDYNIYSPGEMATTIRNHLIEVCKIHHHGNYRCDLKVEDMLKAALYILNIEDIILPFQLGHGMNKQHTFKKMLQIYVLFFCALIYCWFACPSVGGCDYNIVWLGRVTRVHHNDMFLLCGPRRTQCSLGTKVRAK